MTRPAAGLLSDNPSTDLFVAIHKIYGGRLEAFGGLLQYCMVIHAPKEDDKKSKLFHVGENCYAVQLLQNGKDDLQEAINTWENAELDDKLMLEYRTALSGRPMLSTEKFKQAIAVAPYFIDVQYIRLLLGVIDDQGQKFVLIYSREFSSPTMLSATS